MSGHAEKESYINQAHMRPKFRPVFRIYGQMPPKVRNKGERGITGPLALLKSGLFRDW